MGTYEARPGAGAGDYTNPSPDHRAGSYQGDGPMGTLTSEMFTIGGDEEEEVDEFPLEFLSAALLLLFLLPVVVVGVVALMVVVVVGGCCCLRKYHFNRQERFGMVP